jgi:thiol-disulfide isomerase/thioredoxin/outer membrane lipoprotein-sorting protein
MTRRALVRALPWLPLALAVLGAAPKTPADGTAILRRVAGVYAGAKRFELVGEIQARLTTATIADSSAATFVAASAGGGKLRDELTVPGAGMMRVSDGAKSWIFDGQRGQYVENPQPIATPEGMDSLQVRELGGIVGAILNSYRGVFEGADSVQVLRAETLRVGGKPRLCDVVRARYGTPAGDRTMLRTYWVERQRGVVLQQQTTLRTTSDQGTTTRAELMTFRKVTIDQPVADSLFVFHPPPAARRVDRMAGLDPTAGEGELTGHPAADFSLSDLEGHAHRLSEERGKVVMLDFWATWCGPCRAQMPAVDKLYQEFKAKGLVVFAVNQRESAEKARAYLARFSYTTTTLLDQDGEVGRQYLVRGIPTLVIVGKDGTIVAHWIGVHPESMLRDALKKAGIE